MFSEMLGRHINIRLKAVLGEDSRFRFEIVMAGDTMPEGTGPDGGACNFQLAHQ